MKRISLAVVVSVLIVSGIAFAAQSNDQRQDPSVMDQSMMGEAQDGKGGEDHMMRMMKMMEHCNAMMESAKSSDGSKESPKQ